MNISNKLRDRVITAVLTTIIFVMAYIPFLGYIPLGVTRATIIHVPVIVGAVLLGPSYGAFLGAMFGLTSLLVNTFSPTITSFVFSPFYSIQGKSGGIWSLVICFVPRILIGVISYYVYVGIRKCMKGKEKGRETIALAAAGAAGSLTNTLLVMNLIYFLFGKEYAGAKGISIDALYGVILGIIGVNGIPEAIIASILTAAVAGALKMSRRF